MSRGATTRRFGRVVAVPPLHTGFLGGKSSISIRPSRSPLYHLADDDAQSHGVEQSPRLTGLWLMYRIFS
jgi:hypothetical protein